MLTTTDAGPFAARIEGIDLSQELEVSERAAFRELFVEHGLLVVPGQTLTTAEQQRVMSYVGPVDIDPFDHVPYITNVDGIGETARQTIELVFHIDHVCLEEREPALSLLAVDVEGGRSSTLFASGTRAYAALPAALQERIADLEVVHVFNDPTLPPPVDIPEGAESTIIPLVRRKPETSEPYLFLSWNQAHSIEGLPYDEGRELLDTLFSYLLADDNVYAHVWHQGDFVVWDNNALSHQRGNLKSVGRRVLQKGYCGTSAVKSHTGSLTKEELEAFFNR